MSIWSGVFQAVGGFLSNRSASSGANKTDREIAQMRINADKEMIGLSANEERRTQKERALLEEWTRQNRRSERARGSKNYSQFSGSMPAGYTRQATPLLQSLTPDQFIAAGGVTTGAANQPPRG